MERYKIDILTLNKVRIEWVSLCRKISEQFLIQGNTFTELAVINCKIYLIGSKNRLQIEAYDQIRKTYQLIIT